MLRLSVKPPSGNSYRVPVAAMPLKIGRSSRADLRLDDPFASRLHAELYEDGGSFLLSDLGSGNGTYVNGQRVGSHTRVQLGDRLQIGNTLIVIETAGSAESSQAEADTGELVVQPQSTRRGRGSSATVSLPAMSSALEAVRQAADTGEVRTLAHRQELFGVLSKVGTTLLSPADLDEVLNQILDLIFEAVEAERAYLLLEEKGELVCKLASFRGGAPPDGERDARISRSIVEQVVEKATPVLTSDAQEDERFKDRHSIIMSQARSVMAAPLGIEDRILGMLYVDSPLAANVFSEDDLRLLTTIATIAAVKIENAVLLEQRLENERIKQQLASAREIQSRLLPVTPPAVAGYEIAGMSFPCFEVGGDYLDYVEEPGGRLLLALGDVSGKGLDAALLTSSLHACLQAQAGAGLRGAELLDRVNRFLHATSPSNRFVTLFLGELDPAEHRLRYVNAGHNPALLVRDRGGREELAAGGLPLGVRVPAPWREGEVSLAPGDVLLVYSDGISEAANGAGEELGTERLVSVVERYRGALASEIQELVDQEVSAFVGTAPQADDMTLIVVRRVP